jgi:hypothetical protein
MAFTYHKALKALQRIDQTQGLDSILEKLKNPPFPDATRDSFPIREMFNASGRAMRLDFLKNETGLEL